MAEPAGSSLDRYLFTCSWAVEAALNSPTEDETPRVLRAAGDASTFLELTARVGSVTAPTANTWLPFLH